MTQRIFLIVSRAPNLPAPLDFTHEWSPRKILFLIAVEAIEGNCFYIYPSRTTHISMYFSLSFHFAFCIYFLFFLFVLTSVLENLLFYSPLILFISLLFCWTCRKIFFRLTHSSHTGYKSSTAQKIISNWRGTFSLLFCCVIFIEISVKNAVRKFFISIYFCVRTFTRAYMHGEGRGEHFYSRLLLLFSPTLSSWIVIKQGILLESCLSRRGEKLREHTGRRKTRKMDNDMEEMNDYLRLSIMENNINNNSLLHLSQREY